MAISTVRPARQATICQLPKATKVEISTTGLTTGAARAKAMPAGMAAPLLIRRRAAGMEPHSHTGKASPRHEPMRAAATGLRGERRCTVVGLTKRWMAEETSTPAMRKGRASMKIPRKTVTNPWSRPVQGARAGGTATSAATQISPSSRAVKTSGAARRSRPARDFAAGAAPDAGRLSSILLTCRSFVAGIMPRFAPPVKGNSAPARAAMPG